MIGYTTNEILRIINNSNCDQDLRRLDDYLFKDGGKYALCLEDLIFISMIMGFRIKYIAAINKTPND